MTSPSAGSTDLVLPIPPPPPPRPRRRFLWVVAAVVFLTVALGTVLVVESRPDVYRSSAVVSFEPRGTQPVSGPMLTVLLPRYVAFGTSDFAFERVSRDIDVPVRTIAESVGVVVTPETANITISADTLNPERAHAIVESLASAMLDESTGDDLLRGRLVSPADVPVVPAAPDRRRLEAAGLLAALVLAAGAARLVSRLDGWT